MFTGIVKFLGMLESFDHTPQGGRMRIRAPELAQHLEISGSIAVNGCCLTVVAREAEGFELDLSGETIRRTSFGEMAAGTRLNLEPPLRAGDEFGGHFVQGHVDGVGRVTRLDPEGENWWLGVRLPENVWPYVAMKGSIALDGISLTVAGWRDGVVEIAIIPYTWQVTNVRYMRLGDAVNVEADVLAKYLERLLEARAQAAAPARLRVEQLIEQGF